MTAKTINFLCDYAGVPRPEDPDSDFGEYLGMALIKALGLPEHCRKLEIIIEATKDPLVRYEYFVFPEDPKNKKLVEIFELFEVKLKGACAGTAPPTASASP